jgi:hypothetical protein
VSWGQCDRGRASAACCHAASLHPIGGSQKDRWPSHSHVIASTKTRSAGKRIIAGLGLSDLQHQLMERDEHQHGRPECVARNIGIERLNYAYETVLLLEAVHLFRWCFFAAWALLGFVVTPIVTREGARWFQFRAPRMLELRSRNLDFIASCAQGLAII